MPGELGQEDRALSVIWRGGRARGAEGALLPATLPLPGLILHPAGTRTLSHGERLWMPGNGSTLPNSSPFPLVAMAACDLTEFLGDVPTFSEETKLINTVFLMPSLSAWSHEAGAGSSGGEGRRLPTGRWAHAPPRSHPSSLRAHHRGVWPTQRPPRWCLADPLLLAAGSPQDAGSTRALPAPHRLQLSAAPSFAVLCEARQAHMGKRDYGKTNRNKWRPWVLFSHV